MRLYLEIKGEKHYLDEDMVKEHALHEGMITPYTGLKIKKENNTNTEIATTTVNEAETLLPTARGDAEINTDINEIDDLEDSSAAVAPVPEFSESVKMSDEAPAKAADTEDSIHLTEDTDSEESLTEATETVATV
jgi:hypothetical protein